MISGVLASAGITVVSNFDPRHDEFAVAQSIMNLSGVDVYVSQDQFDQAKRVLTEARASGRAFEADRADDPNGL